MLAGEDCKPAITAFGIDRENGRGRHKKRKSKVTVN
jgi:hypothetical protein